MLKTAGCDSEGTCSVKNIYKFDKQVTFEFYRCCQMFTGQTLQMIFKKRLLFSVDFKAPYNEMEHADVLSVVSGF